MQGKLYEVLEQHLGQLAAEIRAAREQYTRIFLGKRKHEDEFSKVRQGNCCAEPEVL